MGRLKGVKGALPLVWEAFRQGKGKCLVPRDNYSEAAVVEGIRVAGVGSVREACDYLKLTEEEQIKKWKGNKDGRKRKLKRNGRKETFYRRRKTLDFAEVHGQEKSEKRSLDCSGRLSSYADCRAARCREDDDCPSGFRRSCRNLSFEESMEVTSIYSIAGRLSKGQNLIKRPFLNPHHSVTIHALAGEAGFRSRGLSVWHTVECCFWMNFRSSKGRPLICCGSHWRIRKYILQEVRERLLTRRILCWSGQ